MYGPFEAMVVTGCKLVQNLRVNENVSGDENIMIFIMYIYLQFKYSGITTKQFHSYEDNILTKEGH